ncbi:hypothetical protein SAMN04488104_1001202 [Algoriphagus faecimaris]|uniref:Uncharacterized protein n=1 Tax=Algoriphagus faecimaris TaxID=686796 RepID=A0A1G6MIY5_9BACT|nr:hypothetical protein SAMN04488104_1001202 [Algoriphagus faecimaris]
MSLPTADKPEEHKNTSEYFAIEKEVDLKTLRH